MVIQISKRKLRMCSRGERSLETGEGWVIWIWQMKLRMCSTE
jgi:hypothetical protein